MFLKYFALDRLFVNILSINLATIKAKRNILLLKIKYFLWKNEGALGFGILVEVVYLDAICNI